MKKTLILITALLLCLSFLAGCSTSPTVPDFDDDDHGGSTTSGPDGLTTPTPTSPNGGQNPQGSNGIVIPNDSISDDPDQTFSEDDERVNTDDGYFDTDTVDIEVECISGTKDACTLKGNVLTFTTISENSVYSISGQFNGNIVIDTGNNYEFELQMTELALVSKTTNPITVLSGSKVTLTAKSNTVNYIYDKREAVDETDPTLTKGAIHSEVDLQIGGKGELTIVSDNNNGIHTKKDLEVKNLTLTVTCKNNAIKGNDSVELLAGTILLISTQGDGIKTSNSDISTQNNQRGTVTVTDTNLTVYAACDGVDSSYDVIIDGATVMKVYTDKYSSYSENVTATSSSNYYIRCYDSTYTYSVKYYNSETDFEWVNPTYHSTKSNYNYYSFPQKTEYAKMQCFIYSSDMSQEQETDYVAASESLTPSTTYDTIYYSTSKNSFSWTNYETSSQQPGGPGGAPGGMQEGNTDKGVYSTKGIKATNEIIINNGTVTVKAYDDALHSDNQVALENGATALGNITFNGGTVSLYSNDDGIHATGSVYMKGGNISVINSYEGVEGATIVVSGGNLSVISKDDGMNSTLTSGTGVTFSGGYTYIYCTGDGIDSNSRTSYSAISFEGGDVVIISNSNGNSSIDSDGGYKYTSGSVVAIMPNGGMTNESTHCSNFSSVGTSKTMSLSSGKALTISGDMNKTITMPCSISNAFVVILNKSVSVSSN